MRRRALRSASTTSRASASSTRKRPGHPEYRLTSGVETTTGPLGQGVATSVGMAIAGKWLAARFNQPGFELFDFDVYAFCGDGDFMEGVSSEAASIAGHQRLDNLCWVYDNNHITIDGRTEITYSDDVADPLHGLRLERHPGRRRQRPRAAHRGVRDLPRGGGPPDPDHRRQPHRLRLAAQAGHRRGPRRAARRGGGAGDQARLRLARGRRVPGPRRGPRALRRGHRRARRRAARRVGGAVRRLSRASTRRSPHEIGADAAPRAARGLGHRHPELRRRREGDGDPQGLEQGRERDRRAGPVAARRLRRPHRLDLGRPRGRRRTSSPTTAPAASSTTGSASTSRRRSPTASRSRSCARSGPPTSPSPTTRGPRSGSRR